MRDFTYIKALVGEAVTEDDLKHIDCYIHQNLGIFIPSTGVCGYAAKKNHSHPTYMITVFFLPKDTPGRRYSAVIVSPDVPHSDIEDGTSYYCIMIDREYFETQYRLYCAEVPHFSWQEFSLGSELLKMLNTFVFEYSQQIPNAEITLEAQATLITHWIIRSIAGDHLDTRSVSADFTVARVHHYMEKYYSENMTVNQLAALVNMSASAFNRNFKKETGLTPIKYLIEVRIDKSKLLLRRGTLSMTEIAALCGFGSSAHFAAEFKRLTNVTPTEYRDAYQY